MGLRGRDSPLEDKTQISRTSGVKLNEEKASKYRETVGALMYLQTGTRPDLAYVVGLLARFFQSPTELHMDLLTSVMRYLQTTQHFGIEFWGEKHKGLVGFSESSDVDNRRSTTGYVFTYNGGAVSWSSRLQPTVAVSTMEAEYMAASAAAKEALWLRKLMCELQVSDKPVHIWGDNQSALCVLKDPISSARSKHIDTMHYFVRERIAMGHLSYQYISTANMVANILTKSTKIKIANLAAHVTATTKSAITKSGLTAGVKVPTPEIMTGLGFSTFEEFAKALITQLGDPDPATKARNELLKLNQVTSVKQYADEFQRITALLPYMDSKDVTYFFHRGLKPQIRNLLIHKFDAETDDWQIVQDRAYLCDDAVMNHRSSVSSSTYRAASHHHYQQRDSRPDDPMELGAISTERHHQSNRPVSKRSATHGPSHRRSTTPALTN
ncbi:hypothetical protein CEUSTIGMA_g893.t1, partial [Chlamydomonas eustigma]